MNISSEIQKMLGELGSLGYNAQIVVDAPKFNQVIETVALNAVKENAGFQHIDFTDYRHYVEEDVKGVLERLKWNSRYRQLLTVIPTELTDFIDFKEFCSTLNDPEFSWEECKQELKHNKFVFEGTSKELAFLQLLGFVASYGALSPKLNFVTITNFIESENGDWVDACLYRLMRLNRYCSGGILNITTTVNPSSDITSLFRYSYGLR